MKKYGMGWLLLAGASFASAQEAQDTVEWVTDLNVGTELARESGRPLLIVFR